MNRVNVRWIVSWRAGTSQAAGRHNRRRPPRTARHRRDRDRAAAAHAARPVTRAERLQTPPREHRQRPQRGQQEAGDGRDDRRETHRTGTATSLPAPAKCFGTLPDAATKLVDFAALPPPPTTGRHFRMPAHQLAPDIPADVLAAEQAHLAESRAALQAMRAHAQSLSADAAGDWVSQQILQSLLDKRVAALADHPDTPLFFGRLDRCRRTTTCRRTIYVGRRHVHDGDSRPLVIDWRAPGVPRLLPGQPRRPDGRRAAPPLRLPRRRADRVRGRAARTRPASSAPRKHPHRGDRTPAHRPDARHRRHHPARPGRDRPRRARPDGLRPGRAGHREDRRRPAPGRLPAVHPPRAAGPVRRHDRRPEPLLPVLHLLRAARARRGARSTRPPSPTCSATTPAPEDPDGRRASRATPGWPTCCSAPCGCTSSKPEEGVV